MSSVVISGDISGSVTLDAPSVAGTTVLTLPATSGTVLTTASGQWITTGSDIYYNTGNVGIGTTSPTEKLQVSGNISQTGGGYLAQTNGTNTVYWTLNPFTIANSFGVGTAQSIPFIVGNNNTERMRIDTNGNVLVGTTSSLSGSRINLVNGADPYPLILRTSGAAAGKFWFVGPNASNNFVVFNQSATTGVFITDGGTSWTASSDETLKTDLKPIENAAEKVSTLRAVTGRYKTDEENISRAFLIAQDVQKVLPEAVSVSTEGTLGLAYTETIPLLVAAIKEQQTIINDLKARVEALENK